MLHRLSSISFLVLISIKFCQAKAPADLKALFPLGFLENKGQIVDQLSRPNSQVKFLLALPGLNVQLKKTGFSYDTYFEEKSKDRPGDIRKNSLNHEENMKCIRHYQRIDIELLNCNPDATILSEGPSSEYFNYFTSGTLDGGVVNVHAYDRVVYKNIYPLIDLEFYRSQGNSFYKNQFEYQFILHPGANVNSIQLSYKGADKITLMNGELTMEVQSGKFSEKIPSSYYNQSKTAIDVKYVPLGNNAFSFSLPTKSSITEDLTIDPIPCIDWCTYYGGCEFGGPYTITLDRSDNVYFAGQTNLSNNIATAGSYQVTYNGNYDVAIAKFNSSGSSLLWGTYYGGTGEETPSGIALDSSNNVLLVGTTNSNSNISTPGALQLNYGGGNGDGFIAKFNSTGSTLLWATYYGGLSDDAINSIKIDTNQYICFTGATQSPNNISSPGAFQPVFGGIVDAFVAKLNFNGTALIWSTYYGGPDDDQGTAITIDKQNNIYISGHSSSPTSMGTPGTYQTSIHNNSNADIDVIISKFSSAGSLIWSTYYGGTNYDFVNSIALDSGNNVYITGLTESDSCIATSGSFQPSAGCVNNGCFVGFVAKFNSTGSTLLWGSYYGDAETSPSTIILDASRDVYISGYTYSPTNIATPTSFQPNYGGTISAFATKINQAGTALLWGTYFGTGSSSYSMAIDSVDNIFIAGMTMDSINFATPGSYQSTYVNYGNFTQSDMFIAKFSCTDQITGEANPVNINSQISSYPNPFSNKITIEIKDSGSAYLYNSLGKQVDSCQLINGTNSINTNTLPQGVYFLRVTLKDKAWCTKLVKGE